MVDSEIPDEIESELALLRSPVKEFERAQTVEMRRSERKFRDFAEAASDVLWELDADLKHSYVSDRYYELTGMSPGRLSEKPRADMPPEADWESWENHLQTLRDHLPFRDYVFPGRGKMAGRSGFPAAAFPFSETMAHSKVIAAL